MTLFIFRFLKFKISLRTFKGLKYLVKTDFNGEQLEAHFQDIINAHPAYSPTFLGAQKKVAASDVLLDSHNRKIIKKLAEGYPSKDLPEMIGISLSAINKRKAKLKSYFNTDNEQDNYIVLEARKYRLI